MNKTCNQCGWVGFGVTRKFAITEVEAFNTYFDTLPKDKQDQFYGGRKSSIRNYEHCQRCDGSYKNFKDSKPGDCPDGCTLSPIIRDQD